MGKKLTIEEVKKRIKQIHGDIIILDESTYINVNTKCRFIDKDYGEYWTLPFYPLNGCSCKARNDKKSIKSLNEIKEKLYKVHGDIIIIDESTYVDTQHKAKFIDKDFGEWWALPNNVINRGRRHWKRARILPIEQIKERIKQIHGDNIVIDELTYVDTKHKCRFVDKDYGEWWTTPNSVLNGHGCFKRKTERLIITCQKKYGCDNPGQNEEVKEKIRKSNKEKYGNECSLLNKEVQEKIKQTNLKLFGTENPFQSEQIKEKIKETNLKNHGCEYPTQNKNIALKGALAQNNSGIIKHWKTGEECIWTASYEEAVLLDRNKKQIEFLWQPEVFKMPDGHTYRPDMYLVKEKIWVEIKGYKRKEAMEKFNWFKKEHPNTELWDKKKLIELGILKKNGKKNI